MHKDVPASRLAGFYFIYYAALGGFTPYWNLFLKERGQDAAAISVLMSLWYGTRIVAPGAWSWLAARSSQPIRWLHLGCVLTLLTFVPFVMPMGFAALFGAMLLFCFFYNAVMPQFEALTLSHLTGRSEHYGAIRVWGSIGFVAVVALLGVVFDHVSVKYLPLLMLPMFAALVASSFVNRYGAALPADDCAEAHRIGLRATLRRREVMAFLLVALLAQISFGPLYTFFSLYLEQHGYRASTIGLYWSLGVLVEIAVFFFAARLFARYDPRSVLLVALASAVLRWLVTALLPGNAIVMALAQLTHALNFAAFFAATMQFMARFFPGKLAGHGQGVFYGFSSGVGGVLGALIAGQAWRLGGGECAFAVGAFFSAAAFALAWFGLPRNSSTAQML
jgi:PPP family 3-phenylpropionic acid transporter